MCGVFNANRPEKITSVYCIFQYFTRKRTTQQYTLVTDENQDGRSFTKWLPSSHRFKMLTLVVIRNDNTTTLWFLHQPSFFRIPFVETKCHILMGSRWWSVVTFLVGSRWLFVANLILSLCVQLCNMFFGGWNSK